MRYEYYSLIGGNSVYLMTCWDMKGDKPWSLDSNPGLLAWKFMFIPTISFAVMVYHDFITQLIAKGVFQIYWWQIPNDP